MKGVIVVILCLFSLVSNASSLRAKDLVGIKMHTGRTILNLSLKESINVIKSLEKNDNIELRNEVVYPEEISGFFIGKIKDIQILEKKPNPKDYN